MKKLINCFFSLVFLLVGTYSFSASASPPRYNIVNGHITYYPDCGSRIVLDAPDEECDVELPDGRQFSCTCSYEYRLRDCETVKSLTDIKDCESKGGGKRSDPPIVDGEDLPPPD